MRGGFFLVFFALFLLIPLGVGYAVARRQYGQEAARKHLPVVLVCVVVGAGMVVGLRFLYGSSGEHLLTIVLLVFALAGCGGLIRYRIQLSEAGDALVNMGRRPGSRLIAVIGFLGTIVAGGTSLYRGLAEGQAFGPESWNHLAEGFFYVTLAACLILWWSRGTTVHGTGIAGPGFFLLWERIEGYEWRENPPGLLKLHVRRRIPVLREILLRTDPERRAEIEEILQRFLPGRG